MHLFIFYLSIYSDSSCDEIFLKELYADNKFFFNGKTMHCGGTLKKILIRLPGRVKVVAFFSL